MADNSSETDLMVVDHGSNARQLSAGDASGQYFPSELSLFEEAPLLAAIASEDYVDYRPNSSNLNSGSLDYSIPMSSTQMLDLRASRHHFSFKIVHASDGSDVNAVTEPPLAPVNLIGSCLWDSIELYLNNTLVTPSGGQHTGYRAMFEALLDTSRFKKDTELQASLWAPDTPGSMGPDATEEYGNEGFKWRYKWVMGSKECHVTSPLTIDLAQQDRLILNGVQVDLKFFRSRSEWHLMQSAPQGDDQASEPGGYKLEITDAFLRMKKKTVVPSVLMGIESTLSDTPALYPVMRTELRKMLCHRGQMSFVFENLYQGAVPSVLALGFVKESACAGNIRQNPFEMEHAQLNNLTCSVDDKNCGHPPMRFYFDRRSHLNSSFLDGFTSLFQKGSSSTSLDDDSSAFCSISRDSYARGYTVFKYVFSSAANSRFLPIVTRGNLRLAGNFSRALEENMTLVVYARFPTMITMDKTRRVTY